MTSIAVEQVAWRRPSGTPSDDSPEQEPAQTIKKPSARGRARPLRKKSIYNIFVRESMKKDVIKSVPHRLKMERIADMWKDILPEERAVYNKITCDENDIITKKYNEDMVIWSDSQVI